MIRVEGLEFDELTRQIDAFDEKFLAVAQDVMDAVADEIGQVTIAAAEPVEPPPPPGEPLVSLDTLGVIATLWAAAVTATLFPDLVRTYLQGGQAIANAINAALGIVVPEPDDAEELDTDLATEYLKQAENRMVRFSDVLWEIARAQLVEGFMKGESIAKLRDRLRAVPGLAAGRASAVARTEIVSASNAGSIGMVQLMGMQGFKVWQATEDARTRLTHSHPPIGADGQRVRLSEWFQVGGARLFFPGDPSGPPEEIINCIVGSTQVSWPGQTLKAVTRRPYRGALFQLGTADGHILTVTPNHPILTDKGYRPAQALGPGDQILTSGIASAPEVGEMPPSVEELHRALSESRIPKRVIGSAMDFHGDGAEAEVEIVSTNLQLGGQLDTHASGHVGELQLVRLDHAHPLPLSDGDIQVPGEDGPLRHGGRSLPSSDVARPGQGAPIGGTESGHADQIGLTARSSGQAQGFQAMGDNGSTDADFPRHLQDALALGMTFSEIVSVDIDLDAHVDVYNLSTSDGWYIGNGITQHNCRCAPIYELDDEPLTAAGPAGGIMADPTWSGVIAVEGRPTGDQREFASGALTWVAPDVITPLLWQVQGDQGHRGSVIVGNVQEIARYGDVLFGRGTMDAEGSYGAEAIRLMDKKMLGGVSIDPDQIEAPDVEITYGPGVAATDGPAISMTRYHAGRIRGVTLCAIPAFVEAQIALDPVVEEAETMGEVVEVNGSDEMVMVTAAAGLPEFGFDTVTFTTGGNVTVTELPEAIEGGGMRESEGVMTAAAYVLTIPDVPPAWWFDEPTDVIMSGALTVTDEGRIYGLVAPAGVDHRSFQDRKVKVPMGNVDYSLFMGRETIVEGGDRIVTGAITMDCGHADTGYRDPAAALDHYDNSCSIVASVRIGENASGVWVAGSILPGLSARELGKMMSSVLSGDWRPHRQRNGWREFAGALLVPVPGFAMARTEASVRLNEGALVASSVPVEYVSSDDSCGCNNSTEDVETSHSFGALISVIERSVGLDAGTRIAALDGIVNRT